MELTSREKDVLKYLCKGCSDDEIGKMLFITVPAVKYHIHNMLEKFQLRDRTQLVIFAFKNGLAFHET